jgi:hypothetical protein
METTKTYSVYPEWIVIISNLIAFLIYGSGIFIMFQLGWMAAILYLVYILAFEYRLLSRHCVNCYYWGKRCGFGKGRVSSLFFRKGDPAKFCSIKMSWKDLLPDLLISLVPLITGIVLIITKFNIFLLLSIIAIILLTTSGNGYVRGHLTCKFCKQRETGCPASELFKNENRT